MLNKNNTAIITIAIPFFNAEKYLGKAIDSVLSQTYQKWELILLDDGSTDTSLEIAKSYEEKNSRIKVYSDGENRNLGYRLNQIPKLVNTKYLARMDADDMMHPKKLEKQLKILLAFPEIDVLGTNAYSIDAQNNVVGIRLASQIENIVSVKNFIHPTIIAKTKWFVSNPYDIMALRIEDAELWYRTNNNYNFKVLLEPLFFYREFGSNYYQKYFKGNKAMLYVIRKHRFKWSIIKIGIRYYIAGVYYFLNNLLGRENEIIVNRNSIKFSELKPYDFFIK